MLKTSISACNPVMAAELKHQRYVIRNNRAAIIWIVLAVLLVVPALLMSLVYSGAGLLLPFLPQAIHVLTGMDGLAGLGWLLMFTANIALYFVVTLITLGLSAGSISREKEGQTWDSLLLTAMRPHQIALGKWWASNRTLLGDHLMVAVVRLGMVIWLVVQLDLLVGQPYRSAGWVALLLLVPLLAAVTLVYTGLDMAFTASLGVLAALLSRGGILTTLLILAVRFAVMIGALVLWVTTHVLLADQAFDLVLVITGVGMVSYLLLTWAGLGLARIAVTHHAWLA